MRDAFLTVLNMSWMAAIAILFVLLARLLLRRTPKVFSYALWAVVLFRLLCPVTLESPIGVMPGGHPFQGEYTAAEAGNAGGALTGSGQGSGQTQVPGPVVPGTGLTDVPALQPGGGFAADRPSGAGGSGAVTPVQSVPFDWVAAASVLWLAGAAVLLVYSVVSALLLRRRLVGAVPLEGSVRLADHIPTPFVLGLLRPKIYLPSDFPEGERDYVLLHERTHIRRFDHVFRALAWLALAVHWFNPLVWLAFHLAGKDMEMSCDEAVLRRMGRDIRADYSSSLLRLSAGKRLPVGPLAFGSGDTTGRIKNVLNYKKPAFWVVAVALIAVLLAGVALATNRAAPEEDGAERYTINLDGGVEITAPEGVFVWHPPIVADWTPLAEGILAFFPSGTLHPYFEENSPISARAWWSEWDSRTSITVRFSTLASGYIRPPADFTVDLESGAVSLDSSGENCFTDEEMLAMARRLAELIRGAEEFYIDRTGGYVPGLSVITWPPEGASYSLNEQGNVVIGGLDSGRAPFWFPPEPREDDAWRTMGWLSVEAPYFLNAYFEENRHVVRAWWTDERRTTIQVEFSSYSSDLKVLAAMPRNFTVDLTTGATEVNGWSGSYVIDEIPPEPYQFTGEEMQRMAGILGALLQGAEKYYADPTEQPVPGLSFTGVAAANVSYFKNGRTGNVHVNGLDADEIFYSIATSSFSFYVESPRFLHSYFKEHEGIRIFAYEHGDAGFSISFAGDDAPLSFDADLSAGTVSVAGPVTGAACFTEQEMLVMARTLAELYRGAQEYCFSDNPPEPWDGPLPLNDCIKLSFTSGAGAWSTELFLWPDGYFLGEYSDSDMGDIGEGYPNGTHYICQFSGWFGNVAQVSEHAWSLTLEELATHTYRPIGEEQIENGIRYVFSAPYGLTDSGGNPVKPGAEFILYTPEATGAEIAVQGEDFWFWLHRGQLGAGDALDTYALRNMETDHTFVYG